VQAGKQTELRHFSQHARDLPAGLRPPIPRVTNGRCTPILIERAHVISGMRSGGHGNIMTAPDATLPSTEIVTISLDDLAAAETRSMLAIWNEKCGGRKFPARSDITPRAMAPVLRNISLLAVLHEENDYEIRVIGDAHVEAHPAGAQAKRISETQAQDAIWYGRIRSALDHVVSTGAPLAFRGTIGGDLGDSGVAGFESVFLPLGPAGERVDHVIVATAYRLDPLRQSQGLTARSRD
jgi:hypothetical protein